MQAQAGAQVLKLFESWAEGLSEDLFERLVIGPHRRDRRELRALGVTAPVIGFPRGAGALVETYADEVAGRRRVALDTRPPAALGRRAAGQSQADPGRARSAAAARRRPGAGRAASMQLLERGAAGPASSTSATASCPTRRSPTSSGCCERIGGPVADDAASAAAGRGRPVQPRRARRPGGGAAVPVQPVQRPGDHRPARPRSASAGRADLQPRREDRPRPTTPIMGGGSPLLPETAEQAAALAAALADRAAGRRGPRSSSPCATGSR